MEIFYAPIALTDETRELDGRIIDCRYVDGHWVFRKLRHDRQHPNGLNAVLSTYLTLFYCCFQCLKFLFLFMAQVNLALSKIQCCVIMCSPL